MAEDPIRRRLVVRGQVQGVFFRDSTRGQAERAGVGGWVRNRDDGTVEVVLEGPKDGVDDVIAFCRQGPERARVREVRVTEEAPEGLSSFEVD
ncbi:MAG: acylphosphatase [Actinomycetota bacterium]|nr:acylphosphatase [Actinomycetota bacterium]